MSNDSGFLRNQAIDVLRLFDVTVQNHGKLSQMINRMHDAIVIQVQEILN